jgi:flagellar biosynthesis protein FlhG
VAVAGGKGGVGKSLVAANMAVYLAQLGKRVVLLDANLGSANLHTFLGIERPRRMLGDVPLDLVNQPFRIQDYVVETSISGLGLVCGEGEQIWATTPQPAQKHRLLTQVRELDVDYLVVDLAPGSGSTALDFFLTADVGILIVVPEPTAIENTYRFIKSSFLRKIYDGSPELRRVLDAVVAKEVEDAIPGPLDVIETARALGEEALAERLLGELKQFRPRLVVNQARTRADHDLVNWIHSAARRRLGINFDALGVLELDDAVWLAVRKRRSLVVEYPDSRAAKNMERIVRRLLSLESGERPGTNLVPPPPMAQLTHYEILEVDAGATDEEIRRAHRRAREMYGIDAMVTCGLFTEARLRELHRRIEEAYETLMDAERRRSYDVAHVGDAERRPRPVVTPAPVRGSYLGHDRAGEAGGKSGAEEIGDSEVTGALLRRLREGRGVELQEIALRTKVALRHLRALEGDDHDNLPAVVYVRGWLVEYVRCFLRVDAARVANAYIQRLQTLRGLQGEDRV